MDGDGWRHTWHCEDCPHKNDLSERERAVAMLAADGFTNSAIADRLYMQEQTVKNHLSAVYQKLGITSGNKRVQLAPGLRDLEEDQP